MKNHVYRTLAVPAAVLAVIVVLGAGPGAAGPPAAGSAAWESMKSLQGDWDGVYGGKVRTKANYRLVSNGTALMETLVSPESGDMVTMYHPDGNRLAMTHYCSESTQSRMRAPGDEGKKIRFSFVGVTNLSSPDAMRMTGLVLTMKDRDHFDAEWTATAMGKANTGLFEFTRKK
ncbi:MAG: hypothetical protein M3167_05665 [Acidobacteriota bacterium]|nr:hypothetical protein [Acidobacteriota bacterium]